MDQKNRKIVMITVAVVALGVAGWMIAGQFGTPTPPKPSAKAASTTSKLIDDMKKSEAEANKRTPPTPEPKEEEVERGSGHRPAKGG